jgi:uncharacterized protein with ParB-like and HNH nuclease domain
VIGKVIEAKEEPLGDIFSENYIFEIPIYQRPLSWGKEQYEKLIEDIIDSMESKTDHFLGTIILQQKEDERKRKMYYIIDGQQRLTSLTILFAVIRDITNNKELKKSLQKYIYEEGDVFKRIPNTMRVKPWEELEEIFEEYVYKEGGTKRFLEEFEKGTIEYSDEEDPKYHLYEAITTFASKLKEKNDSYLVEIVEHILHRVYAVTVKTSDLSTAYKIFMTLNARGLPLEPSDLLKADNLGLIKEEEERKKYAKMWQDMETTLGRSEFSNLISHILLIHKKEKPKRGIYDEYELLFKSGKLKKGVEFIQYVNRVADIYFEKILEPEIHIQNSEKAKRYSFLVTIMRELLPFSDWIPPLLAFYYKFNNDELLYEFLLRLEKKTIIEWLAGYSLTMRITTSGKLVDLIDKSKDPNEVIKNMLKIPYYGPFPGFNSDVDVLQKVLDSRDFSTFQNGKAAKYILLRLEIEEWELELFKDLPNIDRITIEHILPREPPKNSKWIKLFTEEERKEWTGKLGNLILLSGRANSRAKNYDFEKKKEAYERKWHPFKLTQELKGIQEWNMEELKRRHEKLIKKCIEIYSKIS